MEEKMFLISERYLDELIQHHGAALVGKIAKRFEILSNLAAIKSDTKELIYEGFRDFKKNVKSYSEGNQEIRVFKFKGRE